MPNRKHWEVNGVHLTPAMVRRLHHLADVGAAPRGKGCAGHLCDRAGLTEFNFLDHDGEPVTPKLGIPPGWKLKGDRLSELGRKILAKLPSLAEVDGG